MQLKRRLLIPDNTWKGTDENKTTQKFINWPNETTYVPIFYDNGSLLTDSLHLVCSFILQITKMGCCGNCHVLFSLLGGIKTTTTLPVPSKSPIKHLFLLFLLPQENKSPDSGSTFYSFKNGLAFCCLHFLLCILPIYANGEEKIHRNI